MLHVQLHIKYVLYLKIDTFYKHFLFWRKYIYQERIYYFYDKRVRMHKTEERQKRHLAGHSQEIFFKQIYWFCILFSLILGILCYGVL